MAVVRGVGFWASHLTCAEAGRKMGCTRQNVNQRVHKGSIPHEKSPSGEVGVPLYWVEDYITAHNQKEKGSSLRDKDETE